MRQGAQTTSASPPSAPSSPPGSPRDLCLPHRGPGPRGPAASHSGRFSRLSPQALAAANLATHARFAHSRILTWEIRLPQLAGVQPQSPRVLAPPISPRLLDRQPELAGGSGPRDQPHGDRVRRAGLPPYRAARLPCRWAGGALPGGAGVAHWLHHLAKCSHHAASPSSGCGCRRPLKRRFMALGGTLPHQRAGAGCPLPGDRGARGAQPERRRSAVSRRITFMLRLRQLLQPRHWSHALRHPRAHLRRRCAELCPGATPGAGRRLFDHHPFTGFGVKTRRPGCGCCAGGKPLANLYGAGSVLAPP